MPYKVWAVNEILTAADMNTYVGNQTILSFAGTAARASAIGTPVEGMLSYVGSGVVEVYAGTATGWAEISGGGGVTVGTAAPATPDEGDLWLNSTEAKMYVYYDDGTSAQWVAAVGGTVPQQGKILQVVSATKTTAFTQASSTQTVITDLTLSITPSSASSKILILGNVNLSADVASSDGGAIFVTRDGSNIVVGTSVSSRLAATAGPGITDRPRAIDDVSINYLDSPNTTSATTYAFEIRSVTGTQNVYVNRSYTDTDSGSYLRPVSTITLMEVAA